MWATQVALNSVQLLNSACFFVTPWSTAGQAFLSNTNSQSLIKLQSIESVMPASHLILCHPLLPPLIFPASSFFPMGQSLVSSGQSIGMSFLALLLSKNVQDLFPVGLTRLISLSPRVSLRIVTKHHSSKSSILWHSAYFIVQLSYPYLATGKTTALTRWFGCESWTIKKAECQRIDAFQLWCWRRLLRAPWTARRSTSPS